MKKKYFKASFAILITLLCLTACADKDIESINNTNNKKLQNDIPCTTIELLEAKAGVELPQNEIQSRAAVTLDDMFRLTEDNDFVTEACIIKQDNNENNNNLRKIGHLTISWKNKKRTNKGYSLSTYQPQVNIKWLNNNGEALNLKDKWFICGIVGGESRADSRTISFGTHGQSKMNNKVGNNKIKCNVPFLANWVKLEIKDKDKIAFDNMKFMPQGVVFKVRVKRNETLIPANQYKYMFYTQSYRLMPLFRSLIVQKKLFYKKTKLKYHI